MNEEDVARVRRKRYAAILKKQESEKKVTAADLKFMAEFEAEIMNAAAAKRKADELPREVGGGANGGAEPDEDFAEWTVRDGVVGELVLTVGQLAQRHCMTKQVAEPKLWKVQRSLLRRFGFEGTKTKGELTGVEQQGLQWLVSIEQNRKASQEWELRMAEVRRQRLDGRSANLETFTALVQTGKDLAEKRNALMLKIRELGAKERRAGTGRNQKAMGFNIVVNDGPRTRSKDEG